MATETALTKRLGIEYPLICGAMYPCSNPELVAAVSKAGGIGIVQPISLIYVYRNDFREGLRKIKSLSGGKPFGMNALVEKNSKIYEDRMKKWVDIALEEGCRFVITALGNPNWVVEKVHAVGGTVFHDVIDRRWAEKALSHGVDGLICVNGRAGGHAGTKSPEELYRELGDLGVPLVCAGGVGDEKDFVKMLTLGYSGVQMGTRFIATEECAAHSDYKQAILNASEDDIVRTERVTGVPLAVIRTPYVEKVGLTVGPLSKMLFKFRKTRHWIRMFYNLKALRDMKRTALKGFSTKDYWQAGKSVATIDKIESAGAIVERFGKAWKSQ